ncbi:MAG: RNA polymerase sigma-70 factor [bacterium]
MSHALDKAGFESLFNQEFKGLVLFAIQYVKDYEAAREIVQEAFISLWDRREQIDLTKQVKSYLSTTVRNRALNYLRDKKKFDSRLLTLENLYPLASYQQPDKLVERELRDQIDRAIGELPEKCREVFLLSRTEHLKYQEIADRLQISVKTVETQMSKALQHLRSRLREYLVVLLLICLMSALGYGIRKSTTITTFTTFTTFTTPTTLHQGNLPFLCIING